MTYCNLCGKAFDELDEQEHFGFDYHVGYGSRHDCEHIKAHFCYECFDKLLDQLAPQLKIPLTIQEYDPFTSAQRISIHKGENDAQE